MRAPNPSGRARTRWLPQSSSRIRATAGASGFSLPPQVGAPVSQLDPIRVVFSIIARRIVLAGQRMGASATRIAQGLKVSLLLSTKRPMASPLCPQALHDVAGEPAP